ncbi:bifunctional glutamate/proline--tRNA ligase [Lepeophtheirus salmonis]|uniref:bifunctional glutamate/proline--tRNA ligase n=1 Tax=Lepeophtheirus salmonis TaxID=72036 RepID=UPI001AE6C586|nr:bifunctional glutamate/proline--tRNA ligase-like [Lepeophtheirus salmonis]XP_040575962.1 bifunctional glutamate/proline--tRNA ligase-like [Lepeophtheirus salmonis]
MSLKASKSNPPLGGIIVAHVLKKPYTYDNSTTLDIGSGLILNNSASIARQLARGSDLYEGDIIQKTEIDHWLSFTLGPLNGEFQNAIEYLDQVLEPATYLVGNKITIADYTVYGFLFMSGLWRGLLQDKKAPIHVKRWYDFIGSKKEVVETLKDVPSNSIPKATTPKTKQDHQSTRQQKSSSKSSEKKEDVGKFVDLPGAEMGKVIVRFPPEASGYLHVGHAKACLLNQHYRDHFQGKLILRFDDTNPAKEKEEFENVILEDLKLLKVKYDYFSRTSDHFETMLNYCEKMIKEETAYVDDTDAETMKAERETRTESKNRSNTVEKNMNLWKEMKAGTDKGISCCVRAKINMLSDNGCMRDPTIYRCKNEPHPSTGSKYKVYPTYDFACPIVDSIEGVTHALRTTEYMDRDEQFFWFINALGLRQPHIYAYSRLSLTNTVMSKRKLTWFVESGQVEGWNDPRFPTVRGVIRRGLTIEALKNFILAQGSSRSVVFMEWDKIWAFNRKIIDPIAPRYTTVDESYHVLVNINGLKEESVEFDKHPKNSDVGKKTLWRSSKVIIDGDDAEALKENEKATFINLGNVMIRKIHKANGKVSSIDGEPLLDDKDYKKTLKVTWLANVSGAGFVPTQCVYFDHIISKSVLEKNDDFKNFVNRDSKFTVNMIGDHEFKKLAVGDIIQVQRRGYFIVDKTYKEPSPHSCKGSPIVLIAIPDGTLGSYGRPKSINAIVTTSKPEQKSPKKAVNHSGSSSSNNVSFASTSVTKKIGSTQSPVELDIKIREQGNKIRDLKAAKADKSAITQEVNLLLSLKAEFKSATGKDWKPDAAPKVEAKNTSSASDLDTKIRDQGNKIRDLKAAKADKSAITQEVNLLLSLKAEFKSATGKDWKPDAAPKVEIKNTSSASDLDTKIRDQGNKIRDLKAAKADKSAITQEVNLLLSLKAEFKSATGKDWKPDAAPKVEAKNTSSASDLDTKIRDQGNKIRDLKAAKADKSAITQEVNLLLSLKAEFKSATGKDWKPDAAPKVEAKNTSSASDLDTKIRDQGNKIRDLKAAKADKSAITQEVNLLLSLKAEFKSATGKDWKPDAAPKVEAKSVSSAASPNLGNKSDLSKQLNEDIIQQGNKVRNLKTEKADKMAIDTAVKILLDLKAKYKSITGVDWKPSNPAPVPKPKKDSKKASSQLTSIETAQKQSRLGMEAKKEENLSDWYSQIIVKSEMLEYYDISGCYVLRPWSFAIWENLTSFFDREIKKHEVQNCYFPMFVSKASLQKEEEHIDDFSPEVAWVTKSGDTEMAEPIAIRPTSETVMYPTFAKWIQSHRDLPLKINQWCNVVRWEFKHPQPFLRTREFLWQEGHTAHANMKDAKEEVLTMLDLYRQIYEDLMAVPVIRGKKTEKEKFAGGDFTTTVEAYISASGRAIQGATSHYLGQNFSKMFDVTFEDPETGNKQYVYQNSWGFTTRTIGVLTMVHGDNQGLVLPPKISPVQVVIVPCGITANLKDEDRKSLYKGCEIYEKSLVDKFGVRVKGDYRENISPGWKFNHWELKGVPIRLELGPRDMKQNQFVVVRRDTGEKITCKSIEEVPTLLDTIQREMFAKAKKELDDHLTIARTWNEFMDALNNKNLIHAPFCGDKECEEGIKDKSKGDAVVEPGSPSMGAKSLCIPFNQVDQLKGSDKCLGCGGTPKYFTLFGRSY